MANEELKPCPFCGGPGKISECGYKGEDVRVHCSTDWGHCVSFLGYHNSPDSRARLVKRWNTRPTEKECSTCELMIEAIPMGNEDALQSKMDALMERCRAYARYHRVSICRSVTMQKEAWAKVREARAKCHALGLEV